MKDYTLKTPHKKRRGIAIGSTVRICDGSYMYTYKDGEKEHWGKFPSTHIPGKCRDKFIVIGQSENYGPNLGRYASEWEKETIIDTKIVNMENGETWYCNATVSLEIVEDATNFASIHICSTEPPRDERTYPVRVTVKYFKTMTTPKRYDNCIIGINKVEIKHVRLVPVVPVVKIVYVPVAVVKYVPVTIVDCFLF